MAFTFLSPILQTITGFSEGAVNLILVLYGLAIAAGNSLGGKLANKNPILALTWLFGLQAVVLLIFAFVAPFKVPALIALTAMGALAFANHPGLQLYVVQLAQRHAPGAVDVASALNIAAFNLGIAIGAWAGGQVVASSLGLPATPWVGALFVTGGLGLTLVSGVLDGRRTSAARGSVS